MPAMMDLRMDGRGGAAAFSKPRASGLAGGAVGRIRGAGGAGRIDVSGISGCSGSRPPRGLVSSDQHREYARANVAQDGSPRSQHARCRGHRERRPRARPPTAPGQGARAASPRTGPIPPLPCGTSRAPGVADDQAPRPGASTSTAGVVAEATMAPAEGRLARRADAHRRCSRVVMRHTTLIFDHYVYASPAWTVRTAATRCSGVTSWRRKPLKAASAA
ncbi:hypothetical protein ACRAWF_13265 [Streptomyces sp. L7]